MMSVRAILARVIAVILSMATLAWMAFVGYTTSLSGGALSSILILVGAIMVSFLFGIAVHWWDR